MKGAEHRTCHCEEMPADVRNPHVGSSRPTSRFTRQPDKRRGKAGQTNPRNTSRTRYQEIGELHRETADTWSLMMPHSRGMQKTAPTGGLNTTKPRKLVPGDVELRFQDAQNAMRKAANTSKAFRSSHFDPGERSSSRSVRRPYLARRQEDAVPRRLRATGTRRARRGYQNPAPTSAWTESSSLQMSFKSSIVKAIVALPALLAPNRKPKTAAADSLVREPGNPAYYPDAPFKSDWHELVLKRMGCVTLPRTDAADSRGRRATNELDATTCQSTSVGSHV